VQSGLNTRLALAVLAATLLAATATAKTNDVVTGRVIGVHDGDTLTVLTAAKEQVKFRLHGVDAPELGQAYGEQSKQALSAKAFGKTVKAVVVDTDRYGRAVADLYADGEWINLKMVADGWAWQYRLYSKSEELAAAEAAARQRRLGLWADKKPEPPWEYRKKEDRGHINDRN
jgi:endonuclease YncB( thermonuclease family)